MLVILAFFKWLSNYQNLSIDFCFKSSILWLHISQVFYLWCLFTQLSLNCNIYFWSIYIFGWMLFLVDRHWFGFLYNNFHFHSTEHSFIIYCAYEILKMLISKVETQLRILFTNSTTIVKLFNTFYFEFSLNFLCWVLRYCFTHRRWQQASITELRSKAV